MGARENLQKLADKKREEILELERSLEHANTYLQAIQDSIKALPRETGQNTGTDETATLRAGTLLARAQEAIRKRGSPMHINLLLSEIGLENTKSARVSLVGSIGAYVRRKVIFTRPGPNIFGLIGMEASPEKVAAAVLPESFGEITEGD